jgi:hypothetical protein
MRLTVLGQVCVWSVCLAVLAGCGGGGVHAQSLDGVAALKIASRTPGTYVEEGPLKGAFDGWLVFEIDLSSDEITKWTIENHSGEVTGAAATGHYQISGRTAVFHSRGKIRTGTGTFAHVRPSTVTFRTVDDWLHGTIRSTVTGRVSY